MGVRLDRFFGNDFDKLHWQSEFLVSSSKHVSKPKLIIAFCEFMTFVA